MQTFLPLPDFTQPAACLDWRRLGKQRGEVKQILNTLLGHSTGWQHHPAIQMWRGHEMCLCFYGLAICTEWRDRGYKDGVYEWIIDAADQLKKAGGFHTSPPWLGDEDFHLSHRSNLVRELGWEDAPQ